MTHLLVMIDWALVCQITQVWPQQAYNTVGMEHGNRTRLKTWQIWYMYMENLKELTVLCLVSIGTI